MHGHLTSLMNLPPKTAKRLGPPINQHKIACGIVSFIQTTQNRSLYSTIPFSILNPPLLWAPNGAKFTTVCRREARSVRSFNPSRSTTISIGKKAGSSRILGTLRPYKKTANHMLLVSYSQGFNPDCLGPSLLTHIACSYSIRCSETATVAARTRLCCP